MTNTVSVWRQFPQSFWISNVMEIFERMGWYGFYAVSTLYLTNSVADGGLGNLFGGLLSGVAYQHFGPTGVDRPGAMWVLFAVLAVTTAAGLVVYNRIVVPSVARGENQ